jgi:ubiquinone biosynthesis protein
MINRFKRYRQIADVLVKYGFGILLNELYPGSAKLSFRGKPADEDARPVYIRIRLALEELGPTFIKFGQIMSSRRELLPPPLIAELQKLTDEAAPLPYETLLPVIEGCCGPIHETFLSIEEKPLASASLAQVHKAYLKDGTPVALKVQRPGIQEMIETDILILESLAKRIEARYPDLRVYNPTGMVKEFGIQIQKELDFLRDGQNAENLAQGMREFDDVVVPKIYWKYSNSEMLAMEFIDGVRIDDLAGIRALGVEPANIAEITLKAYLKQIFKDGFFHADPHTGNLLVTPQKKVAFLDFGIMGVLRPERREVFVDLLLGIVENDIDMVMHAYRKLGIDIKEDDLEGFKDETYAILHDYQGISIGQFDFRSIMTQIPEVLRRYHLRVPLTMMQMIKVILMMIDVSLILDPDFNFTSRVKPYLEDIVESQYSTRKQLEKTTWTAVNAFEHILTMPSIINETLKRLRGGKIQVELEDNDIKEMVHAMKYSATILLIGMVFSSIVIGSSLIVLASHYSFSEICCSNIWNLTILGYVGAVAIAVYAVYFVLVKRRPD